MHCCDVPRKIHQRPNKGRAIVAGALNDRSEVLATNWGPG